MSRIMLFNKPYGVLSQFTSDGPARVLSEFIDQPGYYAAGRLDKDSEGLLVLTNDGKLQAKIADPRHKMPKTYWVQVENIPNEQELERMRSGLMLKDGKTRPAKVRRVDEPDGLWPRVPPVRYRKSVPDCWLEVTISEGRNRQVRRMTAAIGHPTLRLIRCRVGNWDLSGLEPANWRFT